MRVRYQNPGTDIAEQFRHSVGNDMGIIRADIGRHLTEKLIQRLLALGELRVLEKIRPQPLVRLTLLFPALSAYCLQVFIKARVMTNMIGDTDED